MVATVSVFQRAVGLWPGGRAPLEPQIEMPQSGAGWRFSTAFGQGPQL